RRRFEAARAAMRRIRRGREAEVAAKFQALIREGYRQVREALPHRAYVILGNVDSPPLAGELERPGVEMVDGRVVEIEGLRVGFLGGGLPTPLRVAGELTGEAFGAKVCEIGPVEVISAH